MQIGISLIASGVLRQYSKTSNINDDHVQLYGQGVKQIGIEIVGTLGEQP
jgi:hypothetical protein